MLLHLSKSSKTGRFHVAALANNYLELSCSQPIGLASKKGAMKNIRAQMRVFGTKSVLVQDNTGKQPVIVRVYQDKVEKTTLAPANPYTPGPNTRKKK